VEEDEEPWRLWGVRVEEVEGREDDDDDGGGFGEERLRDGTLWPL
jgi:hypothetical protein